MSGFLGLSAAGIGSSIGSGVTAVANQIPLQAINGIFNSFRAKRQHKRNKELMALQNQYEIDRMNLQADINKKQAAYSQGLAKEMYDYTFKNEAEYNDPSNQRARLEAAGLNPALMYGSSAAGAAGTASGSTSGAGEAGAVTALQPMGLQVALQAESQKAQIELAQSQAAKNYAEAGKISGVDTEKGKQDIEESKSKVLLNKAQAAKSEEDINLILEQIKEKKISNEVSEKTKEARINSEFESLNILKQKAAMNVTEQLKNEKELELLKKDLENYNDKLQALFDDVATRKLTADAAWAQYEANKNWLEKQYGNKDAEKLQTYTNVGATILSALIDIASFVPQMKMLKLIKMLK